MGSHTIPLLYQHQLDCNITTENKNDSFVAHCYRIYVEDLLALGAENGVSELRAQKYSVVGANLNYSGEIQVGVSFTQKVTELVYT